MPVKLQIQGQDDTVTDQRRAWAERVVDYFDGKLPDLRLLVFIDDTDSSELIESPGMRGRFEPIDKGHFDITDWPSTLADELYSLDPDLTFHYDTVIYIPSRTCNGQHKEVSLTMTLAHELQHFIQYGSNRDLWAWNTLTLHLPATTVATLGLKWRDVPIEYEARVVAKRATQSILGRDRTDKIYRIQDYGACDGKRHGRLAIHPEY